MKNLHVIPTEKEDFIIFKNRHLGDRLFHWNMDLGNPMNRLNYIGQNIYITSDEQIKEGDWYLDTTIVGVFKNDKMFLNGIGYKKIILTTDQDLIKNGVQAIDDEFLEWFVKNPSCEEVEIEKEDYSQKCRECGETVKRGYSCRKGCFMKSGNFIPTDENIKYKIIIPKEEQKQHLIDMMRYDEELGLYDESKQEILDEIEIISKQRIHKYRPMNPHPMSFFIGFNDGIEWQSERMYSEIHLILDNILYWDTCPDSYKISIKKWLEQLKKK